MSINGRSSEAKFTCDLYLGASFGLQGLDGIAIVLRTFASYPLGTSVSSFTTQLSGPDVLTHLTLLACLILF